MPNESQICGETASLSPAVQSLFPSGIVAVEQRTAGDPALLFAEERAHVQRAVEKRVREFAAGRACARRALAEFGIHDFKLLPATDRQPVWPASMVGSISHTAGYCVAVAASKEHVTALGVDSERSGHVGRDLWSTICCPLEYDWCMSLPVAEQPAAITLVFSAKEAFYKCQYPLTGEWLDFHDLRIEPSAWGTVDTEFLVHLNRPLEIKAHLRGTPRGRYLIDEGVLTAGIALSGDPPNQ